MGADAADYAAEDFAGAVLSATDGRPVVVLGEDDPITVGKTLLDVTGDRPVEK